MTMCKQHSVHFDETVENKSAAKMSASFSADWLAALIVHCHISHSIWLFFLSGAKP